tara:strand:+ start:521 stop:772 length:252 start_codon:yes stop_codon:yes gene_type:complete
MDLIAKGTLIMSLKNMEDWINKCPRRLPEKRAGEHFLFLDKNGNVLEGGSDFYSAEEHNTYPVNVFRLINVRMANEKQLNDEQ